MSALPNASDQLPSPPLARAIVRGLSRGTTLSNGVRYIHVGHESWLAAQVELLGEIAEDGHADTKFVRGAYGAGKSHFLGVVQDQAREADWMTSHVECRADQVEIDRFETLYPAIVKRLQAPGDQGTDTLAPDSVRALLERWAKQQRLHAGIRDDGMTRPIDADNRMFKRLDETVLRSSLSYDFSRALVVFARAQLAQDPETCNSVCRWLRGEADRIRLPQQYLRKPAIRTEEAGVFELRAIGKGTAHDVMRGLLWLIRSAGYAGLVLCIDEVEELAKLKSRKRQDQSLQALREFVDHAGGQGGFRHLCMYLAATPEMFEGPDYFPRYDALATRIQPVSDRVNWRAPVVDLDRSPLTVEQMRRMCERIAAVHRTAYPNAAADLPRGYLDRLLSEVLGSRMRVAKPRLLTRVVVDELERARLEGEGFSPAEPAALVSSRAAIIVREAAE